MLTTQPIGIAAVTWEQNIPVGTPLSGAPGQPVACYDVLAKYKHEVNGPLDYQNSGLVPSMCPGPAQR
jgi:hypothetical protein